MRSSRGARLVARKAFGQRRSAVVSRVFVHDSAKRVGEKMADFQLARTKMVENQVRANKVTDERLLKAMRAAPRERFVPAAKRGVAYADEDLPLGEGRWLMEPMLFARLAQLAEVGPDDLVLDVGAGLGYGAVVLGRLASAVVALEESEALAQAANDAIAGMDAADGDNVVVECGPLVDGWTAQAPYDVIFCEGGVEGRPDSLLEQLAEGGRLVAMQRDGGGVQRGVVYRMRNGLTSMRSVFDGATPTLPGFARAPAFTF